MHSKSASKRLHCKYPHTRRDFAEVSLLLHGLSSHPTQSSYTICVVRQ